jgi:hypothetical protein
MAGGAAGPEDFFATFFAGGDFGSFMARGAFSAFGAGGFRAGLGFGGGGPLKSSRQESSTALKGVGAAIPACFRRISTSALLSPNFFAIS